MLVAIGELADFLLHEGDDLQTKFLSLVALSMMMTTKGDQTFGQADKSDTKGTLVDNRSDFKKLKQFCLPKTDTFLPNAVF